MSKLQKYKSHKIVWARPMSKAEYDAHLPCPELRHLIVNEEPGYLVVYNKDTKDHCESWCPKKQFEAGNTLQAVGNDAFDVRQIQGKWEKHDNNRVFNIVGVSNCTAGNHEKDELPVTVIYTRDNRLHSRELNDFLSKFSRHVPVKMVGQ